ncbi:hypothetical protein Tco_1513276, partial [Tanacetum coccineum]
FHEIGDFLSSSSIHYALTVSPNIYASYIEQFWNTATSQIVNDVRHIHANIDSKAVVVTEASVRSSFLLNDVNGTACLKNEAIFQNLALMGSKSTSWNELSTNIASAVICLATLQKFNFSKLIFDGHKFSGRVTPLFPNMLSQQAVAEGEGSRHPSELQPTPSPAHPIIESQIPIIESSSPQNTQSPRQALHEHTELGLRGTQDQTWSEGVPIQSKDPPLSTGNTVGSGEDSMEQNIELMVNVPPTPHDSPLSGAKTTQDKVITRLKLRVKRLEKKGKARTPQPMKRRLFKGRVETSFDKSPGMDASKQGRNDDKTEELNLTNEDDTEVIVEDKGSGEKDGSTADQVSTARPEVS